MLKSTKRTDPVVWSEGIHQPLTVEQLGDYERQGYLLIKSVFTADEVDRLNERTRMLADKRTENVLFESENNDLRFLLGIHDDELFGKYARDRFILGVAKQILNTEELYIYQSKVVSKGAFVGKEIPFHTDYDVWHNIDGLPIPRITTAAIFITDQEIFNGALMVVPGSHKYFLKVCRHQPHIDRENFNNIANMRQRRNDKIDQEEFRAIAEQNGFDCLTGPKGSILFFDANIIHGSTNNISPFQRKKLFFTYNPVMNKPIHPVRPDFMVSRNYEVIR